MSKNRGAACARNGGGKGAKGVGATRASKGARAANGSKETAFARAKTRLGDFAVWHPVLAVLALAVFTCACLCVVFYLAVFSDISSSADFIYSKF